MTKMIIFIALLSLCSCATKLSNKHIENALIKIQPQLEQCVQHHTLLNPNEQFATVLKLRVTSQGKPKPVEFSGMNNAGLKQCLQSEVYKLKFNIEAPKNNLFSKRLIFKIVK